MKITDVEAIYLRLPEIKERSNSSQDTLLIKITTDSGLIGWGEVDSSPLVAKAVIEAPMSHAIMMGLKRLLVGQDPFETQYLWHTMHDKTLYYGRAGAVIQTMHIAQLAHDRGLKVCNHNFTTDINTAASLHFLASIPNALIMEYCAEPSEISRKLVLNPIEIKDGYAEVPMEPGLGIEPDPAMMEKYAYC